MHKLLVSKRSERPSAYVASSRQYSLGLCWGQSCSCSLTSLNFWPDIVSIILIVSALPLTSKYVSLYCLHCSSAAGVFCASMIACHKAMAKLSPLADILVDTKLARFEVEVKMMCDLTNCLHFQPICTLRLSWWCKILVWQSVISGIVHVHANLIWA